MNTTSSLYPTLFNRIGNNYRETTSPRSTVRTFAVSCLITFAATWQAFCASQIWSNAPIDATWTNINNWVGRAIPGVTNLTGNTVNNDVVTINAPIPNSNIGSAASPILTDDATIVNDRSRQIGGITFDTANCGAYVISNTSPAALPTTGNPETGILNVSHNGSIQMTAAVTNSQTIAVPVFIRLPASTAGIYNFVNNSTNAATLYIVGATNDSANTRGTVFTLGGSNTGTNTIGALSAGATTSGANGFTKQGNGTWILPGPNDFRAQTVVQVLAGTLIVNDPGTFNLSTNITVTNTGVLQINGASLNQIALNLNKGGTIRMNGSASVNGVAVGAQTATTATLTTVNPTDVFTVGTGIALGAAVGGGAADTVLNTAGPGTLVFGQPNTYAGRWSFAAATNQISNSGALGTGANANLAAGAILDLTPLGPSSFSPTTTGFGGSGTGSTVGSTAATVISDPAGMLDLTGKSVNLTFSPTSSSGDSAHPALYIAQGGLTLSGNTFFINNASGSPLGVGTYRIIQQASGGVTSGGGYAVIMTGSGIAGGTAAEIQVSGGDVSLVISLYVPKNLVWVGGNPDSTWNVGTTANFLNGATPSAFNNSDNVTFNSTGSANSIVNLAGTLAPSSATVDTSANDYTFGGSGQIGGPTGLTKLSTGNLVLQTANTYAGGTIVSNGVIRYGANNAISSTGNGDVSLYGAGALDLNNFTGTINGLNGNGAVDNQGGGASVITVGNNDRAGTFSGLLKNTSGTLGLTKIGTNILTLTASNIYMGPTTLTLGTLAVANEHALGTGDVSIAAGTLDVRSSRLFLNSLAGSGGLIANNSITATNLLVIQGSNTTTFGGSISDGSGGGGLALTVLGGSLTLSGPNTYSGGTIVASGASFFIANGPAAVTGGLIASNNATVGLSGGSSTPGTPTSITTVDGGTVILTAGAEGKIWTGQFIGNANTTNRATTTMSFGGTTSFQNFLGVVRFEGAGNIRFFNGAGVSGGDNTIFEFTGSNIIHTRDAQTTTLGQIRGGSSATGIDAATAAGALDTYIIGARNVDSIFEGYFRGTNNLVKSGSAQLIFDGVSVVTNTDSATFTNYIYSGIVTHFGTTTISNGVLALIAPNDLSNSASITLAASTAVLDASQMGYVSNFTDANGPNSVVLTNSLLDIHTGQTLGGLGTIRGTLLAESGSTVSPGLPTGVLTVTNSATLNGAVNFQLERASAITSGSIAAPSIDITGATITVTNVGPDLVTGDSYQLFSVPISGTPAAVNLPVQNQAATITYVWTNKLAINGTIQVLSGASPVSTSRTNITIVSSGNTLDLSWPADHTGWTLQTNSTGITSSNSWFPLPGSAATNHVVITVDRAQANVFYRLVYQ
jgi:autotransporter-associated beta strand protein